MCKLVLEKAEEPEIKWPTYAGSSNKMRVPGKKTTTTTTKNTCFCFIDYAKTFDCVDHNKLENSERDGNTRPPNLPLRNLYAGQEATVRIGHGTMDWFQIGKEMCQGCILSPCYFNLHAEYIM